MNETEKKPRRATRRSYKDVQIAYLADGVAGVDKLVQANEASEQAVRQALAALRKQGASAVTLQEFIGSRFATSGRGRVAPRVDEERSYRAQQTKSGGPWIHLPLEPIGAKKGTFVRVLFEHDQIVVTRF